MARLTAEQWEQARTEYELRGVSLGEVAKQFGVTRQAVSKQAQKDGWVQGKSCGVVEKKVNAIKALHEAECESCHLPATFQHTIDDVVRERLEADHMLAQFDRALSVRGLAILQSVATAEEWETMTRGRRNMAPAREAQQQTTVNVTQQQAQAMPPPSPQPQEALRQVLRGVYPGASALFFALAEIDTNPMPEWGGKPWRSRGAADPVGGY